MYLYSKFMEEKEKKKKDLQTNKRIMSDIVIIFLYINKKYVNLHFSVFIRSFYLMTVIKKI